MWFYLAKTWCFHGALLVPDPSGHSSVQLGWLISAKPVSQSMHKCFSLAFPSGWKSTCFFPLTALTQVGIFQRAQSPSYIHELDVKTTFQKGKVPLGFHDWGLMMPQRFSNFFHSALGYCGNTHCSWWKQRTRVRAHAAPRVSGARTKRHQVSLWIFRSGCLTFRSQEQLYCDTPEQLSWMTHIIKVKTWTPEHLVMWRNSRILRLKGSKRWCMPTTSQMLKL